MKCNIIRVKEAVRFKRNLAASLKISIIIASLYLIKWLFAITIKTYV